MSKKIKNLILDLIIIALIAAIGYSGNGGYCKDCFCKYNSLLLEQGFISIQKTRDQKGYR